jgi:hypothetical protein
MTRYAGLGRTRPKKLTPKAPIPIYREHQIDDLEEEIQNGLQQVETGVEKAEESVSVYPNHPCFQSRDIRQPHLIMKNLHGSLPLYQRKLMHCCGIGIPFASCYQCSCIGESCK